MSINSIEVRIHLNYKFNLRLSNFIINSSIFMVALCDRADHYIFMLFLLLLLFLWSPYLIEQTIYIFILFLSFFLFYFLA